MVTPCCQGCRAIEFGKRQQAHSEPCRTRFEEAFKKTVEGRQKIEAREKARERQATAKRVRIEGGGKTVDMEPNNKESNGSRQLKHIKIEQKEI